MLFRSFVSAPCGSGSGGQGDAGLITVNVSWVDAAGVNQSFSWRPGQLSGTYREEGTQGKFLSGSSSLPNGALASTISDNDANTADLEFASLSTVQTTSASYPTFPSITTPGSYPYLEARFFAGAAGSAYPSARALSGVATTSGVPTPCNGSPFFITTVPCLGLRSDGGANAIIVAYRQSAALSFPLLKIEPGYLGNTCSSAAPCLWQAKYNFQPVSGTKTFDIFRLVPKVSIASYSKLNASGTEAGTGCQDVSLDCTTFGASLASLCDNVRLALGSTLQNEIGRAHV